VSAATIEEELSMSHYQGPKRPQQPPMAKPMMVDPVHPAQRIYPQTPAAYAAYYGPPKKSGFAITGFVLGMVGAGVIGLIFSAIALHKIHSEPHRYGHAGLAVAGLILGILTAILSVVLVVLDAGGYIDLQPSATPWSASAAESINSLVFHQPTFGRRQPSEQP
jgi:hypothetical protein